MTETVLLAKNTSRHNSLFYIIINKCNDATGTLSMHSISIRTDICMHESLSKIKCLQSL